MDPALKQHCLYFLLLPQELGIVAARFHLSVSGIAFMEYGDLKLTCQTAGTAWSLSLELGWLFALGEIGT